MIAARLAAAALLSLAAAAHAQDLSVQLGGTRTDNPRDTSYGWLVQYSHDLDRHLFATFTYQNEGHVPGHHRDGHSVQLWATTSVDAPFSFAVGAGPYHYFDTTVAEGRTDFRDAHGWSVLYGAAATWRPASSPWFYRLSVNRAGGHHGFGTTTLLLGAGYRLDQDGSFRHNATDNWMSRNDELVALGGATIVNSFESQHATARSFEYRRELTPVLRGVVGWVNEGDARLIRRDGLIAQAYFEPSFYRDRFTLGLGYGVYYAVDEYHAEGHKLHGVVSTTFSYNIAGGWLARATWHRIVSTYDRDSDIILVGVGYRF